MISVTEAKNRLSYHCKRGKTGTVSLRDSLDLFTAEDIFSPIDVPSFDNSAMDGYAFFFGSGDGKYQVAHEIAAGDTAEASLKKGEAARIFTGAKMPVGADTVVQQELVELQKGENFITFPEEEFSRGKNVRLRGAQCKNGDLILQKGKKITPGIIGLLASVGISEVPVFLPPKVACLITGNELKEIGQPLESGEIYNSNGPMLQALLRKIGIHEISEVRVQDEKAALQKAIFEALEEQDVIVLSGGISVGDYDFVKECLEEAGVKKLFYKVKQRPGKPLYAGKKDEKWIFALPGNPASVISCFMQYVEPCLQFLMGQDEVWKADAILELSHEHRKKPNLTFFMKAKREGEKFTLLTGQQSFNLLAFSEANCLAELEEEKEHFLPGDKVKIYYL